MLDIKFIRENPDIVRGACAVKNFPDNVDAILSLDARVRELKTITQTKTAEKNKISASVSVSDSDSRPALILRAREIANEIANDESELKNAETELNELLHRVPQIPDAAAPVGPDDKSNVVIKKTGSPRDFDFTPRPHWEILDMNNWWMPEKIAEACGSRTYCLCGEIAELDLAIQTYVIQKLIARGFTFITVPAITKPQSVFDAGHFPGSDLSIMDNDVFMLSGTDRCMSGTAEIVLNKLHADEILNENQLPILYAGYSTCYRREAGAAGRDTRGLMRLHHFHKVEQFVFCKPDQSNEMHAMLLEILEQIFADMEIPTQTIMASTGDMGFNKVKLNDVEAWTPSENKYREVGSCSSIGEFQSRRTNTRYRESATGDVRFCATLNNTAVALPRALVMVIENHQNADGSVNIPKKLQPLMSGRTRIGGN
ncbi:MAG: serine--tRNA ligase [Rickettsiales bacterium]|jgi:seryl-tRNA synthetase|nr:serine--tRNA ligase [Rickettsiales bacterium]